MDVISDMIAVEQNGGSNERIDLLMHAMLETWTGKESITARAMPSTEFMKILGEIDAEFKKRIAQSDRNETD